MDGRCETCRFFQSITSLEGGPRRDLMGWCDKVRTVEITKDTYKAIVPKHDDSLARATGYGHVPGNMLVDWSFGCVMHEKKD